ncbi:MAG: UbiD family decarboxylase [Planctomycetaceae bacterium]
MGYRNLRKCIVDLERTGQLVRIDEEVDPHLEAAEIHRRVFAAGGPAIYFARVKGCRFPMVSNLFGTLDRARFLFRDTLDVVRRLIELKLDPTEFQKRPWKYRDVLPLLWHMRPKRVSSGPILAHETTIDQLPRLQSWPDDGGPFVTLPIVYSEDADHPGFGRANLGMYRVQLSGNQYETNREVGLHYQIHRTIGVHHAAAIRNGEPFRVNVFVGGSPAMMLAAVMPLPESVSELMFAGALGRRRVRMVTPPREATRTLGASGSLERVLPIYAEADFCISGTVDPERLLPEGPFGDHLGYYSLAHDFPVLRVEKVYHRKDAVWPFTVVGRPPQEDTSFGALIHELTGPAIPAVIPGVHAVHAVDAAGVHPLLLAIGSERYVPYAAERRPQELLTTANAILGQGQLSLAKYLWIAAREDDPALDIHDIAAFLAHVLRRVDWTRDLHFQTRTTIDTLDYSGTGLNEGSKLVIAAAGPVRRELPGELPGGFSLPEDFGPARIVMPGVLAVSGPRYPASGRRQPPGGFAANPASTVVERRVALAGGESGGNAGGSGEHRGADAPRSPVDVEPAIARFCEACAGEHPLNRLPLVVLVDDADFTAETLDNFLWVTFTRSNPAADVYGVDSFTSHKHWGCRGALVIDARIKPHHAPPLIEDPETTRRVDRLGAPGGPLHGII